MARLDRFKKENDGADEVRKRLEDRKRDNRARRKENRDKNGKKNFLGITRGMIITLLVIIIAGTVIGLKIYGFVSTFTTVRLDDTGYTHAKQYKDYTVVNGIDVSEHQGNDIQWKKAKYSGADFVFVRVGYRSTDKGTLGVDANYRENIEGAQRAGLMVGAYYYSQAVNAKEAEEEATAMLELVKDYDLELPLVIDFELYSGGRLEKEIAKGNMTTSSAYHDIALAFCRKVEAAGYDSGIYGNYDMFTNYMDASVIEHESNLWLAHYSKEPGVKAGYRFWQCAEDARVGGIKGNVDHDFMYLNPQGVTKVWYASSPSKKSLEGSKIKFRKDSFKSKNTGVKPKIDVAGPDGRRLRKNKDYVITYANNVHKGTGTVIVRGVNAYRDIVTADFEIK